MGRGFGVIAAGFGRPIRLQLGRADLNLPARRVLDRQAPFGEFVANRVGPGEVLGLLGVAAGDELVDDGGVWFEAACEQAYVGFGLLGLGSEDDAEDVVDEVEGAERLLIAIAARDHLFGDSRSKR